MLIYFFILLFRASDYILSYIKLRLNTLKKIAKLNLEELHIDKGLRWELIVSRKTAQGNKIYSLRFSQKYRALAYRDKNYLVVLGLFTDHDSAYL